MLRGLRFLFAPRPRVRRPRRRRRVLFVTVDLLAGVRSRPRARRCGPSAPRALDVGHARALLIERVRSGEVVSVQGPPHPQGRGRGPGRAPQAVSDPESPSFGKYPPDAEFDQKYAPDAEDVAALRAHLEAHGLTVGAIPAGRIYVPAQGTAAQIEAAFGTEPRPLPGRQPRPPRPHERAPASRPASPARSSARSASPSPSRSSPTRWPSAASRSATSPARSPT